MRLSGQFKFFKRKNLKRTKTQIKPKRTNKTKLSEQKTTKATTFGAQKVLRGRKLFILRFCAVLYAHNLFVKKFKLPW